MEVGKKGENRDIYNSINNLKNEYLRIDQDINVNFLKIKPFTVTIFNEKIYCLNFIKISPTNEKNKHSPEFQRKVSSLG